jgi:hypothetical protein
LLSRMELSGLSGVARDYCQVLRGRLEREGVRA